jgi:hypothetical protein
MQKTHLFVAGSTVWVGAGRSCAISMVAVRA